jgi:hypothetical protein
VRQRPRYGPHAAALAFHSHAPGSMPGGRGAATVRARPRRPLLSTSADVRMAAHLPRRSARPAAPREAARGGRRGASRAVAAALLAASGACHSWQQRPLGADGPPAVSPNRAVRVMRADQSTIELARPAVVGDSLVGEVGTPPVRTAVASSDVRRLEERRVSTARTTGLVVGGAALLFVVLLAAAVSAALTAW